VASLLKRYGSARKTKPAGSRPETVFASEEIPRPNAPVQEYWYARSLELWTAGRRHDALALLYRESIRFLGTDGGNHIPASATEEECVRIINSGLRKNLPAGSYFTRLAQTRVAETYACRTATEADFLHLRNGLFELETIGGVK